MDLSSFDGHDSGDAYLKIIIIFQISDMDYNLFNSTWNHIHGAQRLVCVRSLLSNWEKSSIHVTFRSKIAAKKVTEKATRRYHQTCRKSDDRVGHH